MKRLLALIGAVALIVGAIGLRQLIAGDDDGDGGGGGGDGDGASSLVVACVGELEDACRALADAEDVEVVVEDADATMDKLVAGDSGYDGWITLAPWPEIVGFERPEDGVGTPSPPVASTDLVLAVPDTAQPCGGQPVTWTCLGDNEANVGVPPRTTALGLVLVGNAATNYFGRSDIAINDFDATFEDWLDNITANPDDDPLRALLRAYPPALIFDAVGTTRAEYDDQVLDSRAEGSLPAVDPDPTATANVVLVPVAGGDVAELADSPALVDALTESGWTEGGPDATGLPNPGVMYDLLTR